MQSIPYLGQKKIIRVLSPGGGLLSFFVLKQMSPILTTPFLLGEWVYRKGQKEIQQLTDAGLLDDLSALKKSYAHLSIAGLIAQDLLRTQFPGKAAHEPFSLAFACLRKLPLFSEPATLLASFRLKLLSLEGLLSDVPPHLEFLLRAKSFHSLASLPKQEHLYAEIALLFEGAIGK